MPPYRRIIAYIREQIRSGTWTPGTALPSKAELAKQFGVSASTVARALNLLKDTGEVYGEQGRAVFVAEPGRGRKHAR